MAVHQDLDRPGEILRVDAGSDPLPERSLLEQAAAHPERPLSELAPWSEAESRQILSRAPEPSAEENEQELETRLAGRGERVEGLRAGLSEAKRAALARLLAKKKRPGERPGA